MKSTHSSRRFKYAALVSVAMLFLAMIPQIHLWAIRGRHWNGTYVIIQGDEPLYSAYLNSIIEGRTRRNDPFGGKDNSAGEPLPESTFSIQFIPPYLIAGLARLFHASASTAMIALIAVAAFFGGLSVFWLLASLTDDRAAAAGTLFVLCLGGLVGGHALIGLLVKTTDLSIPSLPFLRRYQPAATFWVFIGFIGFVYLALSHRTRTKSRWFAFLAGIAMGVLIFSYLYLWTAAAAWLFCLSLLWVWQRPNEWSRLVSVLLIVGAIGIVALVPYKYLVSQRPATLDEQQTLAFTHYPDPFRIPELVGLLTLILLLMGISRGRVDRNDPRSIVAASLALLPLLVFNQQVVSGRSMQPYHYAALVVNYTVLIALFIGVQLWWKPMPRRVLIWIAALSFVWGFVEVSLPSRVTTVPAAVKEDQIVPVLLRLKQLASEDGTTVDLRTKGRASTVVFSPQIMVTALLPTWTSQGTLPDAGGIDFGHITREERKQYFYLHLYYAKADIGSLREALKGNPSDQVMKYYARAAIFGHERIVPALASSFRAITDEEIENEIRAYQTYANSFSLTEALKRPLTYVVIPVGGSFDFSNIDHWYERDRGERVGEYVLYRVKLKAGQPLALYR